MGHERNGWEREPGEPSGPEVNVFGLMRAGCCGQTPAEKLERRRVACGSCKALGVLYGAPSRLLLDHDAVFLAEVLTALGPGASFDASGRPRPWACFRLPAGPDEVPAPLRLAAAATVVLAAGKLDDRVADGGGRRWRLARRLLARVGRRARADLSRDGFPLAELDRALAGQPQREAGAVARAGGSPAAEPILDLVAAPTARATELFFAHGALAAGRPDEAPALARLGAAFGRLVYLVDAWDDLAEDARRGTFNAFRTAYRLGNGPVAPGDALPLRQQVWSAATTVLSALDALPLPAARRDAFASRVRANVSGKLAAPERRARRRRRSRRPLVPLLGLVFAGASPRPLDASALERRGTPGPPPIPPPDGAGPSPDGIPPVPPPAHEKSGSGCCDACDCGDGCDCCCDCGDGCDCCSSCDCGDCCSCDC